MSAIQNPKSKIQNGAGPVPDTIERTAIRGARDALLGSAGRRRGRPRGRYRLPPTRSIDRRDGGVRADLRQRPPEAAFAPPAAFPEPERLDPTHRRPTPAAGRLAG